jgi:high affinity sulfate transporter 1
MTPVVPPAPQRKLLPNLLPVLQWGRGYTAAAGRIDVIAGLSLAAFVIPESLAYASLAELPPVSGLYCYLVAGIAYAVFGTSKQLAVGPTSSLAVVVAAGIAAIAAGDPSRAPALAAVLALLLGLIACGGRLVGLGHLAYFISDTVLIGFKTGAALYIASTQLPKLFGIEGVRGNFFDRVFHVAVSLPETHIASLLLGVAAIALFLVFERALPGRPTTLVVVAASIAVTIVFSLADHGVHVVGHLPSGLPAIGLPTLHMTEIAELLPTAFACFVLAYAEAISTARTFAQKYGYEIDPDQELTALGACNLATGLAHGFPVAGGMSQTAVNDMGNATSPAALVVTSLAIALTLLFLAPVFRQLPEPVLGAIVLMAAKHLVRFEDLRRLRAESRGEFRIALIAFLGVLILGLLNGVLLAALGSIVLLIARVSRPIIAVLERDPVGGRFVNRERYVDTEPAPGVLVLRTAGAWVYFNAEHIRRHILELVDINPTPVGAVVLNFSMTSYVDVTGASALRNLARALHERGIKLALAELRDDVRENLKAVDAEQDLDLTSHRRTEQCVEALRGAPATT